MTNKKSEIRLYPSFTEVREDVTATAPYHVYLPQDLYNQIMPGSLSLEGVKVLSMNAILRESNLEGKVLHVHLNEKLREVKVVRARDLLVQDLETKRYFYVGKEKLEFTDIPEETGTEVTFELENEGDAVLSYLMYAINWKPRYTFNINGANHEFQGWADINNNSQREYVVDKTELFGGDVSLTSNNAYSFGARQEMAVMRSCVRSAPKIQSQGETSGLYMYTINDKFVLAPRSTFSLPFASPTIELEKLAQLSTYFSEGKSKGKFSRVYRIKSSEFLPTGSVTVREDGRVVGQANIPNLSSNESNDLIVGEDPDVHYEREVNSLEVTPESTKYEVTIKITNTKKREAKFEYIENIGNRHDIISMEPKLVCENNGLKHESTLAASESVSVQYVVLVHYN